MSAQAQEVDLLIGGHHASRDATDWQLDPTRTYLQRLGWKPRGLWLSIDDDWRRWCEDEQWNTPLPEPVMLAIDTTRCLWLKTPEDLDAFTDEWGAPGCGHGHGPIYWPAIAERHAGIIIAPYQWSRRLNGRASDWYYSWDVASACVWDLSALASASVSAEVAS